MRVIRPVDGNDEVAVQEIQQTAIEFALRGNK
jgi:hypothetical protein